MRFAIMLLSAALCAGEEGCCSDKLDRKSATPPGTQGCASDLLRRGQSQSPAADAVRGSGYDANIPRVKIEAGTFRMGTDRPKIVVDGEGPSRAVHLSSAFWLDAYECTNFEFAQFADATHFVTESERFGWSFCFNLELDDSARGKISQAVAGVEWWLPVEGSWWREPTGPGSDVFASNKAQHPVVHVSWHDAAAYCAWRGGRLPTEAEWEHAARGAKTAQLYPWGNELLPGGTYRANLWQGDFPTTNTRDDGFFATAPVGSFPAQTASGLHDLIGNVWEWVDDWWSTPDARGPANGTEKLKKGGSFLCHRSYCYRYRSAARHKNSPDSATSNNGFRCAHDAR